MNRTSSLVCQKRQNESPLEGYSQTSGINNAPIQLQKQTLHFRCLNISVANPSLNHSNSNTFTSNPTLYGYGQNTSETWGSSSRGSVSRWPFRSAEKHDNTLGAVVVLT